MGPRLSPGFPGDSVVKNPPANAGEAGLIPGSGRAPGEGNGHLLQYFFLGNPMDRETWRSTVHGVAKNQTLFNDETTITTDPAQPLTCWGQPEQMSLVWFPQL